MGLLGLENTSILSDRIFKIISENKNLINFKDFILYLDKSLNGGLRDKWYIQFRMIDPNNKGYFVKDDLHSLVYQIAIMW